MSSQPDAASAFSALSREDLDDIAELAAARRAQAAKSATAVAPDGARHERMLQLACCLGSFDPFRLQSDVTASELQRLLDDCTVSVTPGQSRWVVRNDVRQRFLQAAARTPGALAAALKQARAHLDGPGGAADELGRALITLVLEKKTSAGELAALSPAALSANQAVLSWLAPIERELALDTRRLADALELAQLLEPFRFLTGYDAASGGDAFVGRDDALQVLRSFVGTLAPTSMTERVKRGVRRLLGAPRDVLFFSGVGGVGKSTLLAKFVLEHVARGPGAPYFCYLDFDRSTISAVQPVTLLLEIVRQLGQQCGDDGRDALQALRGAIHADVEEVRSRQQARRAERTPAAQEGAAPARWRAALPEAMLDEARTGSHLAALGALMGRLPREAFLLVLDTFEQAQYVGDDAVARIEAFVAACRESLPGVRCVIAGRDDASGFFPDAQRLQVEEFGDHASRVEFLRRRGLGEAGASLVAAQVGGRPLALMLGLRLARELGTEGLSLSVRLRSRFDRSLVEGILMDRIISHIDNVDVQKLANPGLVLRRIDHDILCHLLAPLLGEGELDAERLDAIAQGLRRQRDLVREQADGSFMHRDDVRKQMLQLMKRKDPDRVRDLHARAVAYYERKPARTGRAATTADQVEEIYHRLATGYGLERVAAMWSEPAREALAQSVDEIDDVAGKNLLNALLGKELGEEEASSLPQEYLGDWLAQAVRRALAAYEPEKVEQLIERFPQAASKSLLRLLRSRVYDELGRRAEAHKAFSEIVARRRTLEHLLAAADFFERGGGHEPLRQHLIALLRQAQGQPGWTNGMTLALQRLRYREMADPAKRVSALEMGIAVGDAAGWHANGVASDKLRWLLALSNDIDTGQLALVRALKVTPTMKKQLDYLSRRLRGQEQSARWRVVQTLSGAAGTRLGARLSEALPDDEMAELPRVLRYLLRPETPQWYVPIASLLMSQFGGAVPSATLLAPTIAPVPFPFKRRLGSTRAVVEFLIELDTYGVLGQCLRHTIAASCGDALRAMVHAYMAWRKAVLMEDDDWPERPSASQSGERGRLDAIHAALIGGGGHAAALSALEQLAAALQGRGGDGADLASHLDRIRFQLASADGGADSWVAAMEAWNAIGALVDGVRPPRP
nr:hypothetical protein [uncultured Duganella sp.]